MNNNNSFACLPRAFFVSVHFFPVLGKSATWNNYFSSFTENVNTHSREFEFSYLALTPYREIHFLGSPMTKHINKLELAILSDVFATVASKVFQLLNDIHSDSGKDVSDFIFPWDKQRRSARQIYFEHIVFAHPVSFQIQNGGCLIKVYNTITTSSKPGELQSFLQTLISLHYTYS